MDVERRWVDPLAVNDGCGELNCQRSDRHGRSKLKTASSGRTVRLLGEKTTFPNVSRLKVASPDPKGMLLDEKTTFQNVSRLKVASPDPKGKLLGEKTTFQNVSRLKTASPDLMAKLLDEEATFPSVSMLKQQCLRYSFFQVCLSSLYAHIPPPPPPKEEYEIGKQYFDTECPNYSHQFFKPHVPILWVGQQLDVLNLLGDKLLCFYSAGTQNVHNTSPQPNNRSRSYMVSTTLNLMGKYIMICCVYVPLIWSSADARTIYHTSLASHELARRGDFALVVVPMMKNGFTRSFSAYEHFLSGFSCLAVPFGEYLRREYICSVLGFDGQPKVLILDPTQRVLYHGQPEMFSSVGGAECGAFPFTPDRMSVFLTCERVRRDQSLDELLGLKDTDVLYNIGYYHAGGGGLKEEEEWGGRRSITVSQLKKKFVGIYLCSNGRSLWSLQQVYEESCKRKESCELEIVVVGYPFDAMVPPKLHEKFIVEALESVKLLGWWVLPFNNTVCHRLFRISEIDSHHEDLFIVDPIRKYVDPYGLPVMCDFGVDGYPFNRKNLIDKELKRKMGLRLNSLLLPFWEQHVITSLNVMGEIPLAEVLENKPIVVLYMYKGGVIFGKNRVCFRVDVVDELAAWYQNSIKGKHSNVVVVTVSMDGIDGDTNRFLEMGWLVCPADPSKSAKLCDEYFCHPHCRPAEVVLAFGEDGWIQSVGASHILESQGPPFHAKNIHTLRAEIAKEFYMGRFRYMFRDGSPW